MARRATTCASCGAAAPEVPPDVRADTPILHVDLDAFFAAVEQLDDPRLRGKPVVVGGLGHRGVVSTASYEARPYGVHSAMPMTRARSACPDAVFLSPRMSRYVEKSQEVMAILGDVTPLVEQLSVDEAFLDVSGARRLMGAPVDIAALVRWRIHDLTGLTASVGVASTKFLAKLASELAKPDGLLAVRAGEERAFLAPLPVSRLWGVGPSTLRKLDRMALRTIGDIAAIDGEVLERALGSSLGAHLHALARNDDPRAVVPERDAKSIGAEETFDKDLRTRHACERELVRLTDRMCARLRRAHLTARTITLKIRFGNFETRTRARTLSEPTDVSTVVLETARELLEEFDLARGIRLLGVSCSRLDEAVTAAQSMLALDDDSSVQHERTERRAAVERAVDVVRERFGPRAVGPATLVEPDRRVGE
jgi:DNA polymerase-4